MAIDQSGAGQRSQNYDPENDPHPLPFISRGLRVGIPGTVVAENELGDRVTYEVTVGGDVLPYYFTDILPEADGTTAGNFVISR